MSSTVILNSIVSSDLISSISASQKIQWSRDVKREWEKVKKTVVCTTTPNDVIRRVLG